MRAAVDDVHHRHGQTRRADCRRGSFHSGSLVAAATACAFASETPSSAFAPSLPLFGVPSSAISFCVEARLIRGVEALERAGDRAVDVRDRLGHALADDSASCRHRAARPLRASRSRHRSAQRRGRMRRPSSVTSASSVGLPRESRISRAWTLVILVMSGGPRESDLIDACELHQMPQQADFQRLVCVHGHRDSGWMARLREDVVAAVDASQLPSMTRQDLRKVLAADRLHTAMSSTLSDGPQRHILHVDGEAAIDSFVKTPEQLVERTRLESRSRESPALRPSTRRPLRARPP